jgi:hypothetical protein
MYRSHAAARKYRDLPANVLIILHLLVVKVRGLQGRIDE